MANYKSRGQQRDKPFRDALRMEACLAADGEPTPAPPGSLRYIARQLLIRAGTETAACREVADRLDGKVPQAVTGEDGGAITLEALVLLSQRAQQATDQDEQTSSDEASGSD